MKYLKYGKRPLSKLDIDFPQNKQKSYENDVFIAPAISNIFQNYNHCSLEMEQLSTDISIAKICLLNYFINCWWLSYRQNTYGKKKKENRFENHRRLCITCAVKVIFTPDRIRILRQSWDEWALIMSARLMRGPFSLRGQTNMKKLRLSLPNLRKIFNIVKFRRAYILERSLFQTTKGRSAHYY